MGTCALRKQMYSAREKIILRISEFIVRRCRICGIAKKMYRCYSATIYGYKEIGVPRIASSRWSGSNCDVCKLERPKYLRRHVSRKKPISANVNNDNHLRFHVHCAGNKIVFRLRYYGSVVYWGSPSDTRWKP